MKVGNTFLEIASGQEMLLFQRMTHISYREVSKVFTEIPECFVKTGTTEVYHIQYIVLALLYRGLTGKPVISHTPSNDPIQYLTFDSARI